jgi:hypothetical protein
MYGAPERCRRSVRAFSLCNHNYNGSESTVVETVDQTCVVYYVAEPNNKYGVFANTALIFLWPYKQNYFQRTEWF